MDADLLGSFRLGAFAGPFEEFAVEETRSGTDQGAEVRCVDRSHRVWADWIG